MARIRSIKPQFFEDIKIGRASISARLLFIGLWVFSDDHGVGLHDFTWMRSNVFKYDRQITNKILGRWFTELVSLNLIIPFESNGEKYFWIKNFRKHQLINKPSKFRYAEPPQFPDDYRNDPGMLPEQSRWDLGSRKKEEGRRTEDVEEGGEYEGGKEHKSSNPFLSDQRSDPHTHNPLSLSLKGMQDPKTQEEKRKHEWLLREQASYLKEHGDKDFGKMDWEKYTATYYYTGR